MIDKEQSINLNLRPDDLNLRDEDVLAALLNMGGPKTNADIKDFQKRLFSDPLLIRFPFSRLLQKTFAQLLVTSRLKESQARYRLIGGGSPIYPSTERQRKALEEELKKRGRNIAMVFSFNYSSPFPEDTIKEAKKLGKKYLLPLSLYPHFSKATTASNLFYLKKAAQRIYPELKFLQPPAYYLQDGYIQAFADRIWEQILPGESLDDFYLLFSAHGLPLYFLTEGDPYPFEAAQTAAKILTHFKRYDRWSLAYQSAVGPMKWIGPPIEKVLQSLGEKRIKRILVVPISFVSDHIETLCEINIEYRAAALKLGITDFRMSRAIECHPEFISTLADCVEQTMQPSWANPCIYPAETILIREEVKKALKGR